jgi:hypothetical protein
MPYNNKTLIMTIHNYWENPPEKIWDDVSKKLDKKLFSYFTTIFSLGVLYVYWDLSCPTGKEVVKKVLMRTFFETDKGKYTKEP